MGHHENSDFRKVVYPDDNHRDSNIWRGWLQQVQNSSEQENGENETGQSVEDRTLLLIVRQRLRSLDHKEVIVLGVAKIFGGEVPRLRRHEERRFPYLVPAKKSARLCGFLEQPAGDGKVGRRETRVQAQRRCFVQDVRQIRVHHVISRPNATVAHGCSRKDGIFEFCEAPKVLLAFTVQFSFLLDKYEKTSYFVVNCHNEIKKIED
mmetsp:Transcript_12219/g.26707  ORF Transcript_12219/g.26707 Transcript_12219/m.26707 type:complete len:207 (+) Transcript_12219:1594-2214(+)